MPSEIYNSKLLFLYYKALHLNADYQNFCRHMNGEGDGLIQNLIEKYDNIIPLHVLFGDLSAEYNITDEDARYRKWLKNNSYKFIESSFTRHEIVKEGIPITPKAGVVYFTISKHAPDEILSHFFSASMWRLVEQLNFHMKKLFMPVKQTNWLSNSKIQSTSQRLDVYYWAIYKANIAGTNEPNTRQVMSDAYYSGKKHWHALKSSLDDKLKTTFQKEKKETHSKNKSHHHKPKLFDSVEQLPATIINSNTTKIRKLRTESIHLINNTLLGYFPSPVENESNAPILFGSIKDAIETGGILT